MSDARPSIGKIAWTDLTVPNADEVRAFYEAVAGWNSASFDMGGHSDYCMNSPQDGNTVAGICHARGENAERPAQWLIYITVADLKASIRECRQRGGQVLVAPKDMGEHGEVAVIRDPAGAVAALLQPREP